MPPSSVAARSLALAVIGVGTASFAAHGQTVTAFAPCSGVGLPGGPVPQYGSQAASPIVRTALIDRGVKSKIEVGAFAGDDNERVDVLVPTT